MKTYYDCLPCFIRQSLDAAREITDDQEIIGRSLKRVIREVSEFDLRMMPPEMGQVIHRIIREETGNPDPYKYKKDKSTEMALELAKDASRRIKAAGDPFETALRFAIAGNIMDFAFAETWNRGRIEDSFNKAEKHPVDSAMCEKLKNRIKKASSILFIGDNTGETVFDRLFIEEFPGSAPVCYAVKQSPVINDATEEDALKAGLDKVAKIINNGTDAPGTVLRQCSKEFLGHFYGSEIVIAKGQANFETLTGADREVFLLTQVKCRVIAEHYNFNVGDWIITTNI
ncbi:MAG: DUF89 family protein [Oligoflexia bacterium]|nr:DUF89 family protein [Oligoflexia bacterium]